METADLIWLIPLLVWDVGWKGAALWRAARRDDRTWFIVLLIASTAGILPIIYLKVTAGARR